MKLLEIKSIYTDGSIDILDEVEIKKHIRETSFEKMVENIITNLNYGNRIDFKEGKKQVVELSVTTDGTMVGQLEGTDVYWFTNNKEGLYQY